MLRPVPIVTLSTVFLSFLALTAMASVDPTPSSEDRGEEAQVRAVDAALAPSISQEILDAIATRAAVAPEHLAINEQEMAAIGRGELELAPSAPIERPDAPMMVELQAQLEATRAAMSDLHARYVEALETGDSAMLTDLDRQITLLQRDNEESLLRTQLRFAIEAERTDEMRELQSALQAIETQKNASTTAAPSNPLPPTQRARNEEAGR